MGYHLTAFIGMQQPLQLIADSFNTAKLVHVGKAIYIIPMTEILYDEINKFKISDDIGSFTYMSENMETVILKIIENNCVGYIEAEYFGGEGGQTALLWENGKRSRLLDFCQDAINSILKHLGIIASGDLDEFDTIGLGRHRHLEDWL